MRSKAVFFSIDALIAIAILLSVILIVYPAVKSSKQETLIHHDLLKTLSVLKTSEIDNSYIQSLISQGFINDTNKSLLEQIGEFYISNPALASAMADSILSDIETNKNIGIWYGNKLISSLNTTPIETAENIETARQLITGIKEGESVSGFSARAFLTSSSRTQYFYFGGYVGDGNITAKMDYVGNISSAKMELVINNDFDLYINGVFSGNYAKSDSEFIPKTYNLPLNNFHSGENTLEIKGNNLHIAGGFIKITYDNSVQYEQPTLYSFPGINGLINIYDGFYIPGSLSNLDISLHLNTQFEAFLVIGNTTVFQNVTQGEQTIAITNSQLSSLLDYNALSKKTIPLRLGLENVSYLISGNRTNADVISVTDLSGSMDGDKIANAKAANRALIDAILNISGNRVGLAGYDTLAKKSDYHTLSNNTASLKNVVDNIWDANGWTCICCGILKAISCYDKNIFQDNFNNQTIGTNPKGWTISESGGFIDITGAALEGDRSVIISRTASSNPEINHQFPPQENDLSIEFLVNHTIGSGRIKIDIEDRDGLGSFRDYIVIKLYSGQIRNNDATITPYSLNQVYKIKVQVVPGSSTYNLYVNDALVGSNLPVFITRTNIARIRFSTENAAITYIIDNAKVYLNEDLCTDISSQNKTRTAIIMSDGQANAGCGLDPVTDYDNDADTTDDAQDHAIEAACRAYQNYNITTYAIGFGSGADELTLQKIAQCGNGSYYFGNVNEIVNIYQQIAQNILEATFKEQTIETTGNVNTILYPDSFIQFSYQPEPPPYGLIITTEKKFYNELSGNFTLPEKSNIVETRATSYSSTKWTDKVLINNNITYNLSAFGSNYIKLGDPYVINIQNSLIEQNNTIMLTTAVSPLNSTPGSENNKIIYTIVKNASTYSKISPIEDGCLWNIQFEDDTNISIPIPQSYSGSNNCYYRTDRQEYDDNDAAQSSIFELLKLLDLNLNNKIDIKFAEQDLQIDLTEITGIPYTWSTEVQVRTWY